MFCAPGQQLVFRVQESGYRRGDRCKVRRPDNASAHELNVSLYETIEQKIKFYEETIRMRFVKPAKSARPDFVEARIAQLQRQLATEKNEVRKSELQEEINDWQRSRPKQRNERGRY